MMDIETILTLLGGVSIVGLAALFFNSKFGDKYKKIYKLLGTAEAALKYMDYLNLPPEYEVFKDKLRSLVVETRVALEDENITQAELTDILRKLNDVVDEAVDFLNRL